MLQVNFQIMCIERRYVVVLQYMYYSIMCMARELQGILMTVDLHGDLVNCTVKVMYKLVTFHIILFCRTTQSTPGILAEGRQAIPRNSQFFRHS